jgi:pimeloyl-ACP methyl ester carboxylesterase
MPFAHIRGVDINYEVLGDRGPWVVLTTGGRYGMVGVHRLGELLGEAGYRAIVYDRRNCGSSSVSIEGEEPSEQEIWAEDLYALIQHLGASPAYVVGASAGSRTSLIMALKHPEAVRALLLYWVTGGPIAAERLGYNYAGQYVEAAERGGMAAVCETPHFAERIALNPKVRDYLMGLDPKVFIATMNRWWQYFKDDGGRPVIGVSDEDMASIKLPMIVTPGSDDVHRYASAEYLHARVPHSEWYDVYTQEEHADRVNNWKIDDFIADQQERMAPKYIEYLNQMEAGKK